MTTIRQLSELSAVLKSMRKQRGLSQAQVGATLGLSQERVSAMENYPERLTVDNLFTLLMALGAELSVSTDLPKANQTLPFTSAGSLDKNTPIFNKAQLTEISKPTTRQITIRDASGKKKTPAKPAAEKSKTAPKSMKGW